MSDSRAERERWTARYATGSPRHRAPSAWVLDAVQAIPPGALVVDLASGEGRHAVAIAATGRPVVAVDFVESAVRDAARSGPGVSGVVADVAALPFAPATLPALVCVNFLDRAQFPRYIALLEPGGHLVYETYTVEHLTLVAAGRARAPRNPDYTLAPGELKSLVEPLAVLQYREGLVRDADGERHVASVLAQKAT